MLLSLINMEPYKRRQAGAGAQGLQKKALPPVRFNMPGEADPLLVPASPGRGDTKGGAAGHEEPLSRRYGAPMSRKT